MKSYKPTKSCYECVKVKIDGKWVKKYYHRYLWEQTFGEIPTDFQIHHKDGNKLNNDIDNLECVPSFYHNSLHHRGPEINKKGWLTRRAKSAAKLNETNKSSLEGSTTNR